MDLDQPFQHYPLLDKLVGPDTTYEGFQQPLHPGSQQLLYPGSQQPLHPGSQQPLHPGSQQLLHPGSQQSLHPGSQQSLHPGSQQPLQLGSQQSLHPAGSQQPLHPGSQQPLHPGPQQPLHPGSQQPLHPGSQKLLHPGSQHSLHTGFPQVTGNQTLQAPYSHGFGMPSVPCTMASSFEPMVTDSYLKHKNPFSSGPFEFAQMEQSAYPIAGPSTSHQQSSVMETWIPADQPIAPQDPQEKACMPERGFASAQSPFSGGSSQDSPSTMITSGDSQHAHCTVLNPKPSYDKYQKKYPPPRNSEQRVRDAEVQLEIITYQTPLSSRRPAKFYVRREPQAAIKQHKEHPDEYMKPHEWTQLEKARVKLAGTSQPLDSSPGEGCAQFRYECSVNLDSVYLSADRKEVYKLVRAKGAVNNRFQMMVQLTYENGFEEELLPCVYEFVLKSGRTPAQREGDGIPNSGDVDSSGLVKHTKNVICKHLQAETAKITKIEYDEIMDTKNHDIAYYYVLKRRCDFQRGDVVAFLADNNGDTYIDYLTAENSQRAIVAGVISRTAFFKGRKAVCDPDKEDADLVCIIGEVDVKVIGPVQTGELIYTSKCDQPGIAVADNQLQRDDSTTLLGMATEGSSDPRVKLVRCLVSIVLGISSKDQRRTFEEIRRMKEDMEKSFEERVVKIQNRWKGVWKKALAAFLFLVVTGVLCYIFLAPNSPYLIHKCEEGCLRFHGKCRLLKFDYRPKEAQETDEIDGLRFKWGKLKRKLGLSFSRHPNGTGFRYYLNKNRCVTGSIRKISSWLDPAPRIPRINVLAVDANCSVVYYHSNSRGWIHYDEERLKVVQCDRLSRPARKPRG